jgi:hypothetical protein
VTRQKRYRGLVEPSSSVDVDRVGDVFGGFRLVDGRKKSFVLASWGEEEATIRRKGQPSEEGCERLVVVDWCVSSTQCTDAIHAGRVWHDCRQGH